MDKKNYLNINKDAYDKLCDEYKYRIQHKSKYEMKPEVIVTSILKHAKRTFSDISVLEVGPGSGEILSFFQKNKCSTISVEFSDKIASIARETSPKSIFIINNILDVEFIENQFEIIYASAIIHLFPLKDARILLKKFFKWLKVDGYLFINTTMHDKPCEGFIKKADYSNPVIRFRKNWTKEEINNEINKFNFKIVDQLFTDEKNRKKEWIGLILQKRDKNDPKI